MELLLPHSLWLQGMVVKYRATLPLVLLLFCVIFAFTVRLLVLWERKSALLCTPSINSLSESLESEGLC
jgi:hypothetical protein